MGFVGQGLTSPSLPKPPTMLAPRRREAGGEGEGIILEKFQRKLLREHHISGCQVTFGHEAPTGDLFAFSVVFVDVQRSAWANAIALARLPADNVEVAVLPVLL